MDFGKLVFIFTPKFISTGYVSFFFFKLSLLFFIIWDSAMYQASHKLSV